MKKQKILRKAPTQCKINNNNPQSNKINDSCRTIAAAVSNPTKRKIYIEEQELAFLFDPEIDASSIREITNFKLFAEDCCHELMQKCTDRYFACAREKQYYKSQRGWKLLASEKGAYRCDECNEIATNCVGCGSFQVKKKGKLFQCENFQYQLTKELHRLLTF